MFVRSLDRIRRDTRGQSLAEFALAAPILFLLLFGVVEFSRHYYARLGIRHAVAEAARFHATGQAHTDPDDPEGDPFENRAASIEYAIHKRAADLNLTVADEEDENGIRVYTLDDPEGGAGAEGDVIRIEADLRFEFIAGPIVHILPDKFVNFTVVTTFKNEPRF